MRLICAAVLGSFAAITVASGATAGTLILQRSSRSQQVTSDDGVWSLASTSDAPFVWCDARRPVWSVRDSKRNQLLVMMSDGALRSLDLTSFGAWTTIVPSGTPPANWSGQALIYDPEGDRVLLFGGNTSLGLINQLWALQFTEPPQWVQVTAGGDAPAPRQDAAAVLDTWNNRMVVSGGGIADVWALDLATTQWSQLYPSGTPLAFGRGAVLDELSNRIIQVNGASSMSILSLTDPPAWSSAPVNGASNSLSVCYERARNRIVAIENADTYSGFHFWACDLGSFAWTQLHPTGTPPATAKIAYPLVLSFDPGNNRLVEFGVIGYTGGSGQCSPSNGTYLWSFGAPPVSVDPNRSELDRSALLAVQPSPGEAIQTLSLRIVPTDPPRKLEIYSVDGRAIWRVSLAGYAAGSQALRWNGRGNSGRRASPGVYVARLLSDHGTSSLRFVRE